MKLKGLDGVNQLLGNAVAIVYSANKQFRRTFLYNLPSANHPDTTLDWMGDVRAAPYEDRLGDLRGEHVHHAVQRLFIRSW